MQSSTSGYISQIRRSRKMFWSLFLWVIDTQEFHISGHLLPVCFLATRVVRKDWWHSHILNMTLKTDASQLSLVNRMKTAGLQLARFHPEVKQSTCQISLFHSYHRALMCLGSRGLIHIIHRKWEGSLARLQVILHRAMCPALEPCREWL